jgi:hypothetical protein
MLQISNKEFENKFKSNPNVEIFTKSYFDKYIEDNRELLVKADSNEELEDFEKSELNELQENIRSFAALEVYGREPHQQNIHKSIYYVREKQVDWDVSEDGELMKARAGVYRDTAQNRKLGRVGQRFGKHSSMDEDKREKKDGGEKNSPYKSKDELSKMSELEVSKYSNNLRIKRNSAMGEVKKEIQKQIDLADSFRSFGEKKEKQPSSNGGDGNDGGKSKEVSMVLKIMDNQEEPSYSKALKEVLDKTGVDKKKLEKELEKYI